MTRKCPTCGYEYSLIEEFEIDTWNLGHYGCTLANAPRFHKGWEDPGCPKCLDKKCSEQRAKEEKINKALKFYDEYSKNQERAVINRKGEKIMAKDIFSKWDEVVDTEGLAKDVQEAAENGSGSFKEVPHGEYEVAVHQMELKASSKGDPMVSIWFKIVSGEFENSMIFLNQVITQGFQIHIVNELLRAMTAECDDAPVIEFKTYKQYADLILDVFEAIDDNFEFALKYGKGKKDFSTYEITDVFILD